MGDASGKPLTDEQKKKLIDDEFRRANPAFHDRYAKQEAEFRKAESEKAAAAAAAAAPKGGRRRRRNTKRAKRSRKTRKGRK
jgi:hypothetical protein